MHTLLFQAYFVTSTLNTATAIIAEHSHFIWKQQPSMSSEPLKQSFDTFQSSDTLKSIQQAIKGLNENGNEVVAAIIETALRNRLRTFLVFQENFVMPFLTPILAQNFTTHSLPIM